MGKRFFKHGEMPLVLLALLAERPMNAYELMAELGRLLAPAYRPSPGSVYPAVDALEAEGLIRSLEETERTTYEPTPDGTEALEKRRPALAEFELRTGVRVTKRQSVEAALARFSAEVQGIAGNVDPDELDRLLNEAAMRIRGQVTSTEKPPSTRGGLK